MAYSSQQDNLPQLIYLLVEWHLFELLQSDNVLWLDTKQRRFFNVEAAGQKQKLRWVGIAWEFRKEMFHCKC